ncbi:hypothetical protein QNA23_11090 [Rhodococcus erythropolis]|uniref:hypothetical protein n=1 Tax=Rhodococcus erythropolis TaxID=1833 RepID=UPI0024B9022D|nr:hypothetical protein [Rhodococcus erythropolis]MDJ0404027.1 hypothetical protein [Rhodococcus erythropolis]
MPDTVEPVVVPTVEPVVVPPVTAVPAVVEPVVEPAPAPVVDPDDALVTLGEARRLRRENQNLRQSRETDTQQAVADAVAAANVDAEQRQAAARAELAREFGRVLGLVPDEADTEPEPGDLIAAATAAREAAEARESASAKKSRDTLRENAVLRHAGRDVDADALLDSRSFMAGLKKLDTDADDFTSQVKDAIAEAVEADSRFRIAKPAPPERSGADLSAGHADPSAALDETDFESLLDARHKRRGINL